MLKNNLKKNVKNWYSGGRDIKSLKVHFILDSVVLDQHCSQVHNVKNTGSKSVES